MMTPGAAAGENFVQFLPRVRGWAVWSLNSRALTFVLCVIAVAPAVTVWTLLHGATRPTDFVRLAVLLAAAIAYSEACDRIERFRRYLGDDTMRPNHLSVWMIAGIIVLPVPLVGVLVLAIHLHMLVMGRRHRSVRPYRMAFTAAAAVLSAYVARGAAVLVGAVQAHDSRAAIASAAAVFTFFVVDAALVACGIFLAARPRSWREVLPEREAVLFELGTEALGVVAAQLLLFVPWVFPSVLGTLVLLHRASLVKQLEVAAITDPKTALLNAAAWRDRAVRALERAVQDAQRIAVIVIDLDFFKRVNDQHGHLVGDRVLRSVAQAIRNETRARDIVGRFGGEEFVILVDGRAAAAHAIDIATRVRERIAALAHPNGIRVTATIGVAHGVPSSPHSLDQMLAHADAALYEGKAAGRDRVRAQVVA